MAFKRIGEPLAIRSAEDLARERMLAPEDSWTLSPETIADARAIEDNIRRALFLD